MKAFFMVMSSLQLEKYVATSKLKYYFAVDTAYVGKKLGLLIFPYTHSVSTILMKYGHVWGRFPLKFVLVIIIV